MAGHDIMTSMSANKGRRVRLKGINVTVSHEAHASMVKKALAQKPRKNLREYVNIINGIPEEK